MGNYILNAEPKYGKANIIRQHGGEDVAFHDLPTAIDNADPWVYLCVNTFVTHESALIIDSNTQLAQCVADSRPHIFMRVPRNRIAQLQGF